MYEQHFGLKKRPFPAKARGNDVFVGPQTAKTMAGLKKALLSQDAVIAVSGPAGSGKTTLIAKALDAVSDTHKTIRIGRMHLRGEDGLEFLLEELGLTDLPKGPIRQFAALRTRLHELENENYRLVIVVEDAVRLGEETVAELEALTAADAGEAGGAALVLMGDERLEALCNKPQLKRLAQRIRQRLSIAPLCAAELRGYLMHCFRLAGTDFEVVFDERSAPLLHHLSDGIPRVANNVIEASLAAAAEAGLTKIPATFVAGVARDEFGLESGDFDLSTTAPVTAPEAVVEAPPVAKPQTVAEPEPAAEVAPEHEPVPEPEPEPVPAEPEPVAEAVAVPDPAPAAEPVIVFADETDEELPVVNDIPELIQDTLPDLEVLAPEIMAADTHAEPPSEIPELQPEELPVAAADGIPELTPVEPVTPVAETAEAAPEPEPELPPEPAPEPEPAPKPQPELAAADDIAGGDDIPEWDRDPTLAELKPDLDALEKAMAFAHGETAAGEPAPVPDVEASPVTERTEADNSIDEIPEITLDNAIEARVANNLIDEPGEVSRPEATKSDGSASADTAAPKVDVVPQKAKQADAELERIAAELARAKTIEDVDDKLAETLFGEEISLIAAQVVAANAASEPANDEELQLFDTAAASIAQASGTPHSQAEEYKEPDVEVSLETPELGGESGLDLSASQRLKTVRALNADLHPSLREPVEATPEPSTDDEDSADIVPEPIEDQINTSITQTLKTLNVNSLPADIAESAAGFEDRGSAEKKGGFFSRFKRS